MAVEPIRRGLVDDLPNPTPSSVEAVAAAARSIEVSVDLLGLTGRDRVDFEGAAAESLADPRRRDLLAGIAEEARRSWAGEATVVRSFADDADLALVCAACVVLAPMADAGLRARGVDDEVASATLATTATQVALARQHTGSFGMLSAWWQLYGLAGGFIEVGELHAHRVVLGIHPLGPEPWVDLDEQDARGEGWRHGDEAIALHIPHGADLSTEALEATFEAMATAVAAMWPSDAPRLVTCQTWMLDRQLADVLAVGSKILNFQAAFEPTGWATPNDQMTRRLLFGGDIAPSAPTRLQQAFLALWERGGSSQWEVGTRGLAHSPRG